MALDPVPARFNLARYCLGPGAPRDPDKTALIVVGDADAPSEAAERWTYGQLDTGVRRVAAGLTALGLAPGTRIMIRLENTSVYPLLFFGAMAAGLIALPTSSQLTDEEALFVLGNAGASALAVADGLALAGVPMGVRVLREADIDALLAHDPAPDYADTGAEDPAFLVYTSGTSGRPKGVLHAHRSAWGRRPMVEGWYGLTREDVVLHAGAFNWTYTLGVGLTDPWANGATTVVYNGPKDPAVWPRLMRTYGASLFAAVPSVYRQILKYAAPDRAAIGGLRHGLTAGEALAPALAERWFDATGTMLYEALGMSECSTYISSSPVVPPKPGSPGKPQKGRRVAILPTEGGTDPLPAGAVGLLAVHRSDPGLMLGYWNRPEEEEAVVRGDWFVGGDLAEMDEDGYVWFHGRADDLMNAMGYRVSPEEVESVLAAHPDLAEVAVTERQVRADVSVIAAFCVARNPAAPPSKEAVTAFAADHLAPYKCPREVVFLEALPRTPNGKVIRRQLRTV
ncbi:MAG: class I adenylate-forming enzyme family protein [Alphaproteobacteria bacterium]